MMNVSGNPFCMKVRLLVIYDLSYCHCKFPLFYGNTNPFMSLCQYDLM